MRMLSMSAGSQTVCARKMLNWAPRTKKKNIRKKSRSGLSCSESMSDIFPLAITTPAMKAPISYDSPIYSARAAMPRHQPIHSMRSTSLYSSILCIIFLSR